MPCSIKLLKAPKSEARLHDFDEFERLVEVARCEHILRHTFCSHLAMRGAPARAIQELAGHQDLGTTQRYMHLSPAAVDAAIRLLDGPAEAGHYDRKTGRGEIVEAAGKSR